MDEDIDKECLPGSMLLYGMVWAGALTVFSVIVHGFLKVNRGHLQFAGMVLIHLFRFLRQRL